MPGDDPCGPGAPDSDERPQGLTIALLVATVQLTGDSLLVPGTGETERPDEHVSRAIAAFVESRDENGGKPLRVLAQERYDAAIGEITGWLVEQPQHRRRNGRSTRLDQLDRGRAIRALGAVHAGDTPRTIGRPEVGQGLGDGLRHVWP